jgi:hypothetical protein
VQDKRLVVGHRQELGQVRLWCTDVDVRIAVVAEDPKAAIEVEIDGAGLEIGRVVWSDADLPGLDRRADVAIGQDAHRPLIARSDPVLAEAVAAL